MDYHQELQLIASDLHQIANQSWFENWISPVAILFSGVLGFGAALVTIYIQKRREDSALIQQKALVEHTVNDEISQRWVNRIKPSLDRHFDDDFSMNNAMSLANFRLGLGDLFIIECISIDFTKYHFIDKDLVSEIVHAHVLLRDLVDNMDTLRDIRSARIEYIDRRRHEIERENETHPNESRTYAIQEADQEYAKWAEDKWRKVQSKKDELDNRLQSVRAKLS